ncbi:hypothetical protein [Cryptosporangium sp. NPDC048952]|uniref:hypothetical protein n=1 Tax=Cryptosporangium sp. NPDC048952 TaxID=3363961 RepID=UPI003717A9FF
MDERSARTMFRQLAERDFGETTVDVDEAIRGGRRRRRKRTLGWIAAAAAVLVAGIGVATAPGLRDDPKAISPAAPGLVDKATGSDLVPGNLRLSVGREPDGMIGTFTHTGGDYQSIEFVKKESPDGGGGGPLPGYGPASVWLMEATSSLTMVGPNDRAEPGPDVRGSSSTWATITYGDAPGGTLTWTPSPGLRATVVAGSKEEAAQIADSVRTDRTGPVVLPFSLPRQKDLEIMGTDVARYDNGHYSGAVTFKQITDTRENPSHVTFWLARDGRSDHVVKPTTTLHGRPARLSEGPPENGVNVWLQLDGGLTVGSMDAANEGRYFRNRAQIIALTESITPVSDPGDYRKWTPDYLR